MLEGGHPDMLDKLLADGFVDHEGPPGVDAPMRGREDARAMVETLRNAIPDLAIDIEQMVAEDDLVTARTTWRGTHKGDLYGIEGSGDEVEFTAIDIVRVEDGLATERWGLADERTLLAQTGEIEPSKP